MPLSINSLADRRLGLLLEQAENSGAYTEVTKDEFDAMEREALTLARAKAEKADF